jgi:DnaJ-class molecular chaperone
MSAADYFFVKEALHSPSSGHWIVGINTRGERYKRRASRPPCTHRVNHDEDLDALQRQAEEAARLLGMGSVCEACLGSNGVPAGVPDCPDCSGQGWQNDSDTPVIDRLALCDMGRHKARHIQHAEYEDCAACHAPGSYALPTAPCETCKGKKIVRVIVDGRRNQRKVCPECKGSGKDKEGRPAHEYQQPRDLSPAAPPPHQGATDG